MRSFTVKTKGFTDIVDITGEVLQLAAKEDWENGTIHLFVLGSTAALTTIENDPNLFEDLKEVLEEIAPYRKNWKHHQTWGDDNGAAHIRASLFGPSLSVPVVNGKLYLGTWQKIVLIDFDTRPREREILLSFSKEERL